jgi:hypothetical protein
MQRRTTPLVRERRLVMMRRMLAALALVAFASPALAGGHVDIKANALPARIQAGQSVDVSFTITYPNGETVMDAKPIVRMRSGRRTLEVPARQMKDGAYVASVKVPSAGSWSVVVDSRHCNNTCTLSPITAMAAGATKGKVAAR